MGGDERLCRRCARVGPEKRTRRRIVEAILCVVGTGCSWRQLLHDFPPWQTVFWYFKQWRADGTTDRFHDALRDRVQVGRGGIRWPRRRSWMLCR